VDAFAGLADALSQFAEQSKAIFLFQKAAAIGSTIIDTQQAIGRIQARFAGNPPVAAALTAAQIAQGVVRVATIAAQQPPEFAEGGVLEGPGHDRGGIKLRSRGRVVGEAEGGEVILTKNVSRRPALLAQASRINQLAGGKPLMPRAKMQDGGIVQGRQLAITERLTSDGAAETNSLLRTIASQIAQPPVVSVKEINTVSNRVRVLENQARL